MREEKRAAENEAASGKARIARSGSQGTAAHFEAGQMAEREEKACQRSELMVADEAAARRDAEEKAAAAEIHEGGEVGS